MAASCSVLTAKTTLVYNVTTVTVLRLSVYLQCITAPFNNLRTLLNQQFRFLLPSIILVDLLGNRSSLQRVQKVTSLDIVIGTLYM